MGLFASTSESEGKMSLSAPCLKIAFSLLAGLFVLLAPMHSFAAGSLVPGKTENAEPKNAPKVASPEGVHTAPLEKKPAEDLNKYAAVSVDNAQIVEGDSCVSMKLINDGKTLDALTKASTAIGTAVLISQVMHRDVMKIEIYPGKPTILQPGIACIVLRNLKAPLKAGASFDLKLTFEKAAEKTVVVKVVAGANPVAHAAEPKLEENKDVVKASVKDGVKK